MDKKATSYLIYFQRGDKFQIYADTESEAVKRCIRMNPQTASWDILKVERF